MTDKDIIRGTREWSVKSINCCTGCEHNCRYCYARYQMVDRFKNVDDWTNMKVRQKDVRKKRNLEAGTVMFPTTHDITPSILEDCLTVLENLLVAGNNVLIVSKPHMECIKEICKKFITYKDNILFRFTIGAYDNNILKYWEPKAPSYEERTTCLRYAYYAGYSTSVSSEPLLDPANVVEHVAKLEPFITDSIWIGHLNDSSKRVKIETEEDKLMLNNVLLWQTEEKTKEIYNLLKDNPKIKWKESIKHIVGLELMTKPGLDQ